MTNTFNHIAVIPARKNSKSLPYKNRFLFKYTADFLKKNNLFDKVYVNSDDIFLKKMANKYDFIFFKRKKELAGDRTSIKDVFLDMISKIKFKKNTFIWLFYIPLVYKNKIDFEKSIKLVEKKKLKSVCAFKKSETHPMTCWYIKKNKPFQFIKNDLFRRQDYSEAYSHHHYICGFNIKTLKKLNNELIFKNTYPILLDNLTAKKLIEVDTYDVFKRFKKMIRK